MVAELWLLFYDDYIALMHVLTAGKSAITKRQRIYTAAVIARKSLTL